MALNKHRSFRKTLRLGGLGLLLVLFQTVFVLGLAAPKAWAQPAGGAGGGDCSGQSGGSGGNCSGDNSGGAKSTECQMENGHVVLDAQNPCVGQAPTDTKDSATKDCATTNTSGDSGNGPNTNTNGNVDGGASGSPAQQVGCVNLVKKYLDPLVKLLSGLVAVFVAASIVVGGIQYSSSTGDPAKVAKAKKRIGEAVFALLAYLFMFAFLQWLVPGGIV